MADRRDSPPTGFQKLTERRSLRLVVPVAIILTAMWVAAGIKALVTGDSSAWVLVTGPFTLLCGYLFGASLIRKDDV